MMPDPKFWQWILEKNRIIKRYEQERFPLILLNIVRVERVLNFWHPLKFRVKEHFYRNDVSNSSKELSGRNSVLSELVISKDNSERTLPVKASALVQDYPLTVIPFKEFRELKTLTISQYLSGSIMKTDAFPSQNRVQLAEKHVKLTKVLATKTEFEMNVSRSIGLHRFVRAELMLEDTTSAVSVSSHKVFFSHSPVVHEKSQDYKIVRGISQQPEIIHAPAVKVNKPTTEAIAQVSAFVHGKSLDYGMVRGISQQPEIIHAQAVNFKKPNTEAIAQASAFVYDKSLDYRMVRGIPQQPEIIHASAAKVNKPNTEVIAQVSAANNIIDSPKESAIDISRLADQVYQAIEKKIRWEKERRGG